jgi:hypothetical protein
LKRTSGESSVASWCDWGGTLARNRNVVNNHCRKSKSRASVACFF